MFSFTALIFLETSRTPLIVNHNLIIQSRFIKVSYELRIINDLRSELRINLD